MARLGLRRRQATEVREERVAAAPRPRPFWPWLVLLLLLVLAALGASWYFANRDDMVDAEQVPNVVGMKRADAEQRLEERGFELEPKRVVSSKPPGIVVAQRPEPGTLYGEGGIVVLAVARDPLLTEVPDVSGLTTERALARLRAAELRARAQEVPSREPRGTVLRQLPAPGTEVPTGSPAFVVVASGPELATVPAVVGLPVGEATRRLTGASFRSRVARVPSSEPEGTVVAQNPRGRARALRGSVVRLNVSMGPGAGTTTVTTAANAPATVPDTVGQDEPTAVATIEGAGYSPQVTDVQTTDPAQDGVVIRQVPKGGARVGSGATVVLYVGRLS